MSKLKTTEYKSLEELNTDIRAAQNDIRQMQGTETKIKAYTELMENAKEISKSLSLYIGTDYMASLDLIDEIKNSIQKEVLDENILSEFSKKFNILLNDCDTMLPQTLERHQLHNEIIKAKHMYINASSVKSNIKNIEELEERVLKAIEKYKNTEEYIEDVKSDPKISTLLETIKAGFTALFDWLKSFFIKPTVQQDTSTATTDEFGENEDLNNSGRSTPRMG